MKKNICPRLVLFWPKNTLAAFVTSILMSLTQGKEIKHTDASHYYLSEPVMSVNAMKFLFPNRKSSLKLTGLSNRNNQPLQVLLTVAYVLVLSHFSISLVTSLDDYIHTSSTIICTHLDFCTFWQSPKVK